MRFSPSRWRIGWAAATGSFTLANLLFGALIGGACLFVIRDRVGGPVIWPRVKRFAALLALFVKELFLSAIRVALLVVRPDLARGSGRRSSPSR